MNKPFINTLMQTTQFPQAKIVWQNNAQDELFTPFFACLLAMMIAKEGFLRIANFVETTEDAAKASLSTGGVSPILQSFWQYDDHKIILNNMIKQPLSSAISLQRAQLATLLPLAVHSAFDKLRELSGDDASYETISMLICGHSDEILQNLPSFASEVIDEGIIAQMSVDGLFDQSFVNEVQSDHQAILPEGDNFNNTADASWAKNTDNSSVGNTDDNTNNATADLTQSANDGVLVVRRPKKTNNTLIPAFLAAFVLVAAGAFYWYKNRPQAQFLDVQDALQAAVETLPSSNLSLTVGQAGELYACYAEVGEGDLSNRLLAVLNASFADTLCVVDVSDKLASSMVGMDKLTSMIALLKSAPFATLAIVDNDIYINAPNPADIERLVEDIGALMGGVKVSPMPAIESEQYFKISQDKAVQALQNLPININDYALSRMMSVADFDTADDQVPEAYQSVLSMIADQLKTRPNSRFIIAVHNDDTGDSIQARTHTQMLADSIKDKLIAQGVAENQLIAQGVGFDLPRADNHTKIGRIKNRRVEFLPYDDAILAALAPKIPASAPEQALPMTDDYYDNQPTLMVEGNQIVTVPNNGLQNYSQDTQVNNQNSYYPQNDYPQYSYPQNNYPQDDYSQSGDYIGEPNLLPPLPQSPIPEDLIKPIYVETPTGRSL